MASVNNKTISLSVLSTTSAINAGHVITAGDSAAYTLEITWTDITTIIGTPNVHFVLGDGTYLDRDVSDGVTLSGNVLTYVLPEQVYAVRGLTAYVQFLDSNLYTPLKVSFSGIRDCPGTVAASTAVSYPQWASDMRALDFAIGTVDTLAEGESATASITGTIPDKVLNLGIPVGATGDKGDKGDTGDANTLAIGTVTTVPVGGPATAEITGTAPNQTLNLGIPTGATGATGTTAYESAITGGYTDTEPNFCLDLAAMQGLAAELAVIVG